MDSKINLKEILFSIFIILILIILFYLIKLYFLSAPQIEQNKQFLDNSIFKETLNSNKINNCNLIKNNAKKQICKIKLSTCNKNNDSCLYQKALTNNLESNCFKIKNISLKIQCTSIIKYNHLMTTPVLKNDIKLCSNFKDLNSQNACRDNFYYAKSINLQNKTFCNNILNEVIKNECQN